MTQSKNLILEINRNVDYEENLYSISKGSTVKFVLGPSLFGKNVKFFLYSPNLFNDDEQNCKVEDINLPLQEEDNTLFAQYTFRTPGSFNIYFQYHETSNLKEVCQDIIIIVNPDLPLGGKSLPLNSIKCLTVISKCLGLFSTWREKLVAAKQAGYNMIHFTPIQKLGCSNSAYSLCDQLSLNPTFGTITFNDIKKFTDIMRNEFQMLSICDIVVNHTANETHWLKSNPAATYNLDNSPHLRPAYILDALLHKFSLDVAAGSYQHRGLPAEICSENHLESMRHLLWVEVVGPARITEMYTVDVESVVAEFQALCRKSGPSRTTEDSPLKIIQDPLFRRLKSTIAMHSAMELFNIYWNDCFDEESRLKRCSEAFKAKLDELNKNIECEINNHLDAAVNNVVASARYFRVADNGPKIPAVTAEDPIVPRYFYELSGDVGEERVWNGWSWEVVAHNGWVMNDDPLKNFADSHSHVYLRRELIAWGDSVKLRYGEVRSDSKFLWDHMRKYVEEVASAFDGIRLDNCHSTPQHVAEYLLAAARKKKPDLYVVAELFTNSDKTDNVFINRLGITSLIRESMSAWDSHELGRLVYRYGGRPVGSLRSNDAKLVPSVAHALLMDQTHDNHSPVEKRSVFDLLPSSALVAMASTATGSNHGYDQLVPHHIHVVNESREYMGHKEILKFECEGITRAKESLNHLHSWLEEHQFNEVFVDQIDKDIVCITRHNRVSLESYLMIAYTSFSWPGQSPSATAKSITVQGSKAQVTIEAFLYHKGNNRFLGIGDFKKNNQYINGLSEYKLHFSKQNDTPLINSEIINGQIKLSLTEKFLPGSVVALRVFPTDRAKSAVEKLNETDVYCNKLKEVTKTISLIDINLILFKCSSEEPEGTYNIPDFGNLVYAGLQGIMSIMEAVAEQDDQGHPICNNIRAGPWLGQYTVLRLMRRTNTRPLGDLLKEYLDLIQALPVGMKPYYFFSIISKTYHEVVKRAHSLMSNFVKDGNLLVKNLSLSTIQFVGEVDSCFIPPLPDSVFSEQFSDQTTIAAGLPHFSSGYMRCWGRDTFISLRGLLMLTGRFPEARAQILGYGGLLRHGLIPNLLDSGHNPRYNCRDAVWWWLNSIRNYASLAPDGSSILNDQVNKVFPSDDSPNTSKIMKLHEVIQEALSIHFQGLKFRERNAGKDIDQNMSNFGFDNQIGVHPETGFVFGGNEWNCGTWMDKMGSSNIGGNAGKPATPRDGSAVELVALCYSTVAWLENAHNLGQYPHSGVTRTLATGEKISWTWKDWRDKIRNHFEKEFWVGENCQDKLVHKRNIYKDSVGSSQPWADYRFRPNFLVAMVVAPEIFNKENGLKALNLAEKILSGPMGMKTLDPDDMWYCGDYQNSDSTEMKIAQGFNYHQGPEWLWPTGFYLRAWLKFGGDRDETVSLVTERLSALWCHLLASPWRGLPELTNSAGAHCPPSCPTQAWSIATVLEAVYDLEEAKQKILT